MGINDRFADLELTDVTATADTLNVNCGAVAGTATASKAVILDANKAVDEINTAKLSIGATGAEVAVTATPAELNLLDGTTIGTVVASKALAVDANKAVDEINTAKLSIGATGSEIEVTATPAEIVRVCDKSASVVTGGGSTLTITEALHGDRVIVIGKTDGETVTLPAATGTGNKYTFIIGVAATSNANIIKVANATDVFDGSQALGRDTDAEGATGYTWGAETGDDTLTMSGTATGGKVGDRIEVIDYKAGFFSVIAHLNQSGGSEVTPFSATVA